MNCKKTEECFFARKWKDQGHFFEQGNCSLVLLLEVYFEKISFIKTICQIFLDHFFASTRLQVFKKKYLNLLFINRRMKDRWIFDLFRKNNVHSRRLDSIYFSKWDNSKRDRERIEFLRKVYTIFFLTDIAWHVKEDSA